MKQRHLILTTLWIALAGAVLAAGNLVSDVRTALAGNDFRGAESLVRASRSRSGVTPEMLVALSWLGRGALAAGQLDQAEKYARETYQLAAEQLKRRKLDDEPQLPIALGAAIEVQGHALAKRGELGEALQYLGNELARYRGTSIRTRIQKNIHLLGLEGKPAPALETSQFLNRRLPSLASLKGKTVLLFFWAHWCADCKNQAPVLARLQQEFGPRGLVVVGPTQRYGYVAGGEDARPEEETRYIEKIRKEHYGMLADMAVPVSEENFRNYGASSTPTLVLVDRTGVVRMYNPGQMPYAALAARIEAALGNAAASD